VKAGFDAQKNKRLAPKKLYDAEMTADKARTDALGAANKQFSQAKTRVADQSRKAKAEAGKIVPLKADGNPYKKAAPTSPTWMAADKAAKARQADALGAARVARGQGYGKARAAFSAAENAAKTTHASSLATAAKDWRKATTARRFVKPGLLGASAAVAGGTAYAFNRYRKKEFGPDGRAGGW